MLSGAEPIIIPTKPDLEFLPNNNQLGQGLIEELRQVHLKEVEKKMKLADALILPGNKFDLHPKTYSDTDLHPNTLICKDPVNFRQCTEFKMAEIGVIERNLPILAICGGMQLINVLLGGTLIQDLPGDDRVKKVGINHCDPNFVHKPEFIQETLKAKFFSKLEQNEHHAIFEATHGMSVKEDSVLAELYRKYFPEMDLENVEELSIHHQGIFEENLSNDLKASAYAPDALVEALEFKSYDAFALLTQFHVEYNVSRIASAAIISLIES